MNAIQMTLLVCGLAASALASPAAKLLPETPFISCGADTIKTLEVVGCASLPCILRRGTTVTLNVDIVSNADTATLASEIYGNLNGVLVPFSADDQACSSLTSGSCPLSSGDEFGFTTSVDVLNEYPPVSVTIEWRLKDASGAQMACAQIPARIM
ncbi:NPC intracellular cholesterol transporter 2 [Amphibalanus amphitrite]|uniref:NPC intracellular cholesterol transporter 2 n=1 Tax=Amphibalanus amphitrite TaxID=1232801 RepID=A0A6A4WVW8_AMPAM|nr:NPC intracellular cholesterol transporter 2 homolog a-like [Amphibalanus amphitrite]KAF0307994.1 NPC intracellular cholesterol transporter 2 [Amphibalanus amphitrite]